jgi:hypothetical protein
LGFEAPRSHENAVVDHNNPDAYEAVLPGAGSDAQAFLLAEVCQDVVGETQLRFHVRLIAAILVSSRTGD